MKLYKGCSDPECSCSIREHPEGDFVRSDDAQTELEKLKDADWTGSLIDRLNEFARENSDLFSECKDGSTASLLIQQMHGEFNRIKHQLRDILKNPDAHDSHIGTGMAQ